MSAASTSTYSAKRWKSEAAEYRGWNHPGILLDEIFWSSNKLVASH